MTDSRVLLERHRPRLVYDAQEAYFADSAAVFTDSPTNSLKRANGAPIATPPKLSLAYLGTKTYKDGTAVQKDDVLGDGTRHYAKNAKAMHAKDPKYRDRTYGHAVKDAQGRLWLQYWLFYYYNDYNLVGRLVGGGRHEGDWELVQLRLGANEKPEVAVYTQHKTAERKTWAQTPKHGEQPLVYVARGSHANYFGTGSHFTGSWFDQADGKGPKITPTLEIVGDREPAWLHWPGWWGDTKEGILPLDSKSPTSPGRRPHWRDPSKLRGAEPKAAPAPPKAPRAAAHRSGNAVVVDYDAGPEASALVVAMRPQGSKEPAVAHTFDLDKAQGEVEIEADDRDYEVWTSVVNAERGASEAVLTRVAHPGGDPGDRRQQG